VTPWSSGTWANSRSPGRSAASGSSRPDGEIHRR
jgi:hypothetical protein